MNCIYQYNKPSNVMYPLKSIVLSSPPPPPPLALLLYLFLSVFQIAQEDCFAWNLYTFPQLLINCYKSSSVWHYFTFSFFIFPLPPLFSYSLLFLCQQSLVLWHLKTSEGFCNHIPSVVITIVNIYMTIIVATINTAWCFYNVLL